MKRIILLFLLMNLFWIQSKSNNVALSNLGTTFNSSTGIVTVDFDLSWDNSWRTTAINNWDACWVFFKFNDGGIWYHLDLTGLDITLPTGFTYSVPSDKKGIFIYRDLSNTGTGNVALTGCKVGVQPQLGTFDLKAFAIEMVYIPSGPFYVGDGVTTGSYSDGSSGLPYYVNSTASSIYKGTTPYSLNVGGNTTAYNSGFPSGYLAYYLMKYELSFGGYRDYLNCLSYTQQTFATSSIGFGTGGPSSTAGTSVLPSIPNALVIQTPGIASSETPAVYACNYNGNSTYNEANDGETISLGGISPQHLLMFLDWAALRPFTDLEFEKAARGPLQPVPGQYAWGNSNLIKTGTPMANNPFANNEVIGNGTMNTNLDGANFSNINRPLRNGVFATSTTSRLSSGSSYYGVMELTGNLCEIVMSSNSSNGCGFNGSHGDGMLPLVIPSPTYAVPAAWQYSTQIFANAFYIVPALQTRGGSFLAQASGNQISNGFGKIAYLKSLNSNSANSFAGSSSTCQDDMRADHGIRGARTAE